jgi:GNAT superfamily N-acetyltransferase
VRVAFLHDPARAGELRRIINTAYAAGERGLWKPSWERMKLEWMLKAIAHGEIAAAWDDGTIVGCVRTLMKAPDRGEFGQLAVDPAAAGGGAGRALIDFAEAACRERGAREMGLELLVPHVGTHPAKERLHAWYCRLGYRIVGRDDFAVAYPEVADLLAVPCDLLAYRKPLLVESLRRAEGNGLAG